MGIAAVVRWLHEVDAIFSTFRPESEVSRLRAGWLSTADGCADLREVMERCQRLRDLSHGRFDPWAVPGGFDPSGLVKGWAADRAAEVLAAVGAPDCLINAGGDVTVRGGPEPGRHWQVGLQHPWLPGEVHGSVTVTDCAVATSGTYERGDHVWSPQGVAAVSATVVGPDGATADALATALLIEGVAGLRWLTRLPAYSAQVVAADRVTATGPAFITAAG
jgi:thiamine biosynthesis lipoprotein